MTKNVGMLDRAVRVAVAVALLWWAFLSGAALPGALFGLAIAMAAVMLFTAVAGNCPLYRLVGFKTCKDC